MLRLIIVMLLILSSYISTRSNKSIIYSILLAILITISFLLIDIEFFTLPLGASGGKVPNIDEEIEELWEELSKYKKYDDDSESMSDDDDKIEKNKDDNNLTKEMVNEHSKLEEIRKKYDELKTKEIECDIKLREAIKESIDIHNRKDLTWEEKRIARLIPDEKADNLRVELQAHEDALYNHSVSKDDDLDGLIKKQQELKESIVKEREK